MASSSAVILCSLPSSPLILSSSFHASFPSSPCLFHFPRLRTQSNFRGSAISCAQFSVRFNGSRFSPKLRAVAEGEEATITSEQEASPPEAETSDQTVSVAVSPSDVLTMFFQAEGTMPDSAIPAVSEALEVVEGITDLKVKVEEGIASVELTKQTTVQATGVASNLVEIIQGSGFKLQTLNLSFQDEEDFS